MSKVKERLRKCKHCDKDFEVSISGRKKYCSLECMNKESWKNTGAKYRRSEKGKQKAKEWRLKKAFNLSLDDYDGMLAAQNGKCAICETAEPPGYNWHVDHCHTTNVVRGILCSKCNQALGLFNDNINSLTKAIDYLRKHESKSD